MGRVERMYVACCECGQRVIRVEGGGRCSGCGGGSGKGGLRVG